MTNQRTLSIIKPDAVKKGVIGQILARFEAKGLKVAAIKKVYLNAQTAGEFYAEHKERPFFGELVDFMVSGPCYPLVLEGPNAIMANRELMGATNPTKAEAGTIRGDFAMPCTDLSANAVHGSDSEESANREISFFFSASELA
ncbi:MAG: nucleoside-diphosphate kinase [Alphaproteobacteria bacterium CG_4_10_14_0_8_um_filter_53_9]|nr:MAG: nucleoside-diphosphate kinase [Alphaproteobacteria bacterium CG_4_10_14_0_8_um_filter_53_9]